MYICMSCITASFCNGHMGHKSYVILFVNVFVWFACTSLRFMFLIGSSIARIHCVRHLKRVSSDTHINFICILADKGHFLMIY